MASNHYAKSVNNVIKMANTNASRCVLVWAALALREEGYGRKRMKRVLENIYKYAKTLGGRNTIEEQLKHIENTLGIRIVWNPNDELSIEDIEDWDDVDVEE